MQPGGDKRPEAKICWNKRAVSRCVQHFITGHVSAGRTMRFSESCASGTHQNGAQTGAFVVRWTGRLAVLGPILVSEGWPIDGTEGRGGGRPVSSSSRWSTLKFKSGGWSAGPAGMSADWSRAPKPLLTTRSIDRKGLLEGGDRIS